MGIKVKRPHIDYYTSTLEQNCEYDVVLAYTSKQPPLDGLPAKPRELITEGARYAHSASLFFIYGNPDIVPYHAEHLEQQVGNDQKFVFKYLIAVRTKLSDRASGLSNNFNSLLLYGPKHKFNLNKVRIPHTFCSYCGENIRDWGGKKHLMHPSGAALSDVWKDLAVSREEELPSEVLERVVELSAKDNPSVLLIRLPCEQPQVPIYHTNSVATSPPELNEVKFVDCIEYMQELPDGCIDLCFADPPYNLDKAYTSYKDQYHDEAYLSWCEKWLYEYQRILKPTGSLFIVNLPKWSLYHKRFLDKYLHFQNWIVWDALSEPRGKLMPAHYSILHYTKDANTYRFNTEKAKQMSSDYCFRASCIKKRKESNFEDTEPLSTIWWDVPRIKHKKFRDLHPCQLPEKLLERIIEVYSSPGDVVFDAFCGTGTTPVIAKKLGRNYLTTDIDKFYVDLTKDKLKMLDEYGGIRRQTVNNKRLSEITKKELQLELVRLAEQLGRLPSEEDVNLYSKYQFSTFLETFPNFGKALKAAKIYQEQLHRV